MMALKMQQSSIRIDEYLNTFMVMSIIKPEKRESWTLNCLRKYYRHHHEKYLKATLYEEFRVPNIRSIEEVNDKLEEHGLFFDQSAFNNVQGDVVRKDKTFAKLMSKFKAKGLHEAVLF